MARDGSRVAPGRSAGAHGRSPGRASKAADRRHPDRAVERPRPARPDPPGRAGAASPRRRVSLHRALSKLGYASRTEAESMIAAGRVSVGGRIVRDPSWRVDLDSDSIRIDDAPASRATPQYWLLHKPVGYVTTRRDPQGRPTVYDLLPPDLPFVAPIGRLDLRSSGLLLLSNDTQLGARLTDPESHVPKVYEVRLDAPITGAQARRLADGVEIQGRLTLPAKVELRNGDPSSDALVTLVEGRNRQVRRMFASIGLEVTSLHRVAIGPLHIDGLAEGRARPLRPAELRALLNHGSRRRS